MWPVVTDVHRVSKNVPPLTYDNLDKQNPIAIIFSRSVPDKVRNQRRCFVFPPHLSSASALPCKIGNPEDSALLHCACNTVQLLQCSQLSFSWTMPQQLSGLNALITWFRESYSIVSVSCESKRLKKSNSWLNSGIWVKRRFLCFSVLPGSAEAQVIWCGIVICLLIAYFISNISAKKYQNPFPMSGSYSNPEVGCFLRHGVVWSVCLSHDRKPYKKQLNQSIGLWTRVGPRNHVLYGVQVPPWEGNFEGEGRPIVKYREYRLMCGGDAACCQITC